MKHINCEYWYLVLYLCVDLIYLYKLICFYLDLLVLADLHQANNLRTLALKVIVDSGKEIVSQVSEIILIHLHN